MDEGIKFFKAPFFLSMETRGNRGEQQPGDFCFVSYNPEKNEMLSNSNPLLLCYSYNPTKSPCCYISSSHNRASSALKF